MKIAFILILIFQSRDIILKLLESKVGDFWRHYSTRDILEMLRNMTAIQFGSERVLKVLWSTPKFF